MSRYIDADALIAKWEEDIKHIPNASFRAMMQGAINEVSNAPTADVVEVVHGKWIPRTNLPKQEIFICSACGGWAYSPWIGSRKKPKPNWCKYKYCPNCGADMEVEE